MWKIKAFAADFNRTIISEWHSQQDEDVQAAFEVKMKFLREQPRAVWQRPHIGMLRRDCKGLYEIRIKVNNVQHRPIGYFSGLEEFTILAFATERDNQFDPRDICTTAKNRKELIELNRRYAREFRFEDWTN
jgi:hypothetical protein